MAQKQIANTCCNYACNAKNFCWRFGFAEPGTYTPAMVFYRIGYNWSTKTKECDRFLFKKKDNKVSKINRKANKDIVKPKPIEFEL